MSEMNEHDAWSEQIGAYALGALEPDEAARLEAHVEGCESCRERLRWLTPAVQVLPEGVERMPAPRGVRTRVMAEVRADAKRARAQERGTRRGGALGGWLARLRSDSHGWKPALALALVAVIAVGLVGYELGSNDSGGEAPLVREFTQEESSGIAVKVTTEGERGTLALANVDPLPEGRVLEAWVQRDGEVEPVPALFAPDQEGNASTVIEDMAGVEAVMVTREPEGGSQSPTSTPIVMIPIET